MKAERTNIIQRQADDFFFRNDFRHKKYQSFIEAVRFELIEYNKIIHRLIFVERVIFKTKIEYDSHLIDCKEKLEDCSVSKFYENVLFFLQEEIEELESHLSEVDIKPIDRDVYNEALEVILKEVNTLKLGQKIIYDDLSTEFDDLKTFYFLNKTNWIQLFRGKLSEMLLEGTIDEVASKKVFDILNENYVKLISG